MKDRHRNHFFLVLISQQIIQIKLTVNHKQFSIKLHEFCKTLPEAQYFSYDIWRPENLFISHANGLNICKVFVLVFLAIHRTLWTYWVEHLSSKELVKSNSRLLHMNDGHLHFFIVLDICCTISKVSLTTINKYT